MHTKKILLIPAILFILAGCSVNLTQGSTTTPGSPVTATGSVQGNTTPVTTAAPVTKPPMSAEDTALLADWENKVYPGTTIQGIDVSGLSKAEAADKLAKELMAPIKDRQVRFSYANTKDYMSFKRLKVAIDSAVYDEALALGKSGTPEEKLQYIKTGKVTDLTAVLTYDESYITETVNYVAGIVRQSSRQHIAKRVDGVLLLKPDAQEETLDKEAFTQALKAAINFEPKQNKYIPAPVTKVPTKITQADLAPVTTKLTSFSTNYGWSYDARKYNVKLAAEMISGSLVMPGQEFSFNRTIGGGAGESNGFQTSGIYVGLEMVQEPGGGVCQVSSTLYNVFLNLGITPTQRDNHGMRVGYLPPGMDAVIYAPYLDLKFVNPFDTPLYITASADGEVLRFNVYGAKGALGGYTFKYESEVYETNPAVIKEIKDKTIPAGAIVLDPTPKDGSKVRVYKLTYKNGTLIKREKYTDNEYKRSDGTLRIGTGKGKEIVKNWYLNRDVKQYPPGWDGPRN